MEWKSLSKTEVKEAYEKYCNNGFDDRILNNDYKELREKLVNLYHKSKQERMLGSRSSYLLDLDIAVFLYDYLDKNGFSPYYASNEGIWYYLNVCVIPDLVEDRWGRNEGRFYSTSRRIWLKTLWYYVHLSLQEKEGLEFTKKMLSVYNSDYIVQLVERAGKRGYRIDLYRRIMRKQFEYMQSNRNSIKTEGDVIRLRDNFRRVMVLNTFRSQVIEPDLCEGGVDGYVNKLYE